jgi:hypothetical protein
LTGRAEQAKARLDKLTEEQERLGAEAAP